MKPKPGITSADYKAQGGKLLRVRLEVSGDVIRAITITGDFFMHPEEALEQLERLLTGAAFDEGAIRARVQTFFDGGVQVIGSDVEDFVTVIMRAR